MRRCWRAARARQQPPLLAPPRNGSPDRTARCAAAAPSHPRAPARARRRREAAPAPDENRTNSCWPPFSTRSSSVSVRSTPGAVKAARNQRCHRPSAGGCASTNSQTLPPRQNVGPIPRRAGTHRNFDQQNYTAGPVRCIGGLSGGRSNRGTPANHFGNRSEPVICSSVFVWVNDGPRREQRRNDHRIVV